NASHCEARSNEAIQDSKEWIATNATHSRNDKGGDSKAEGDIVLDFFAGSGTTAQAVMELNAEDGGNRQFILVQLDEKIDEAKSKTAYDFCKNQLGSKNPAISDITIERVKRAAQKIKNTQDSNTESSFCVYSLESKPEIINKEGHLHLKMSNSLTPFDKARNLALQSGKTLDKPLKAIIESRLYKCEDSYYIVNYEKSLLAYLQKAENVFVFISAYEEIALEDFLNLEVSSKERLYVVY
ncbi:DNA methyltransferase, partial [uncultured Helicobacter sp.]